MIPTDERSNDYPHHTEQTHEAPAGGYKVEDDDNIKEKDLKKTFLFGDAHDANPDQEGYESHGMGGQSFGETGETRSGDDPANPSRNAGYSNDYFKRTEPLQEHPENQNFKPSFQEGQPDVNEGKEAVPGYREAPDQEKVGGVEGDDNKTQEGTTDSDGQPQKVNEEETDRETKSYYTGTPDYGIDKRQDTDGE